MCSVAELLLVVMTQDCPRSHSMSIGQARGGRATEADVSIDRSVETQIHEYDRDCHHFHRRLTVCYVRLVTSALSHPADTFGGGAMFVCSNKGCVTVIRAAGRRYRVADDGLGGRACAKPTGRRVFTFLGALASLGHGTSAGDTILLDFGCGSGRLVQELMELGIWVLGWTFPSQRTPQLEHSLKQGIPRRFENIRTDFHTQTRVSTSS